MPISKLATVTLSVANLWSRCQGEHRDDRKKPIPPTPLAEGAPMRIYHPFARLRWKSTSDLDLLCSCITRTSIFKSAASFCSSKARKSFLNALTLKLPTLTRRCFLRFTTLRLASDSEEVMVCRDRYLRLLT